MGKFRFTIILLVLFAFTLNLNAQEDDYEAGQWHFGPHFGLVIGSSIGDIKQDFSLGYDIGAYAGYSFTDLIGVNLSALYGHEDFVSSKMDYLKIPALFLLQFNAKHLGLGFQYNHALTKQDGLEYLSYNNNYLSGIIEFGYIYMFSVDAGISGIRSLIRVGYAITPRSYTLGESVLWGVTTPKEKFDYNPYFIEFAVQYNIGQHFNDKKYTRTRK
ncbi:MAG: hypothetical protein M0O93_04660 [Bacteroidales bacterium]|nr:hypothetical protein [Bacteroidales bacterium]